MLTPKTLVAVGLDTLVNEDYLTPVYEEFTPSVYAGRFRSPTGQIFTVKVEEVSVTSPLRLPESKL